MFLRVRLTTEQGELVREAAGHVGITMTAWAVERLLACARMERKEQGFAGGKSPLKVGAGGPVRMTFADILRKGLKAAGQDGLTFAEMAALFAPSGALPTSGEKRRASFTFQWLRRKGEPAAFFGGRYYYGEEVVRSVLLDVDALVPLLRHVRGLLGEGYPDSKSKLDAAWDALPVGWRKLAEES